MPDLWTTVELGTALLALYSLAGSNWGYFCSYDCLSSYWNILDSPMSQTSQQRLRRYVIIDIDSLTNIIKDYLGETYIPADAKPETFRLSGGNKRLEIILDSDTTEQDRTLKLDFQVKRFFSTGGAVA